MSHQISTPFIGEKSVSGSLKFTKMQDGAAESALINASAASIQLPYTETDLLMSGAPLGEAIECSPILLSTIITTI